MFDRVLIGPLASAFCIYAFTNFTQFQNKMEISICALKGMSFSFVALKKQPLAVFYEKKAV